MRYVEEAEIMARLLSGDTEEYYDTTPLLEAVNMMSRPKLLRVLNELEVRGLVEHKLVDKSHKQWRATKFYRQLAKRIRIVDSENSDD